MGQMDDGRLPVLTAVCSYSPETLMLVESRWANPPSSLCSKAMPKATVPKSRLTP